MKTLIVILLDESGSMGVRRNDVIGGFNTFLDDQRLIKEEETRLYLVKFNTIVEVVYAGVPLDQVPPLDTKTYIPGGGTALFDAIAEGVRLADKDKTNDERVICVIMTDGEENSSRETTKAQVSELITSREAKGDWTFMYIGENPEKWSRETKMAVGNVVGFSQVDGKRNFKIASTACTRLRSTPMKSSSHSFR